MRSVVNSGLKSRFELFVAGRYLRARRKEAVISVITAISVMGVAAGVMALVVAIAVTNGFKNTLQRNLLGAMAHINVIPKTPGDGIDNWQELTELIRQVPHVVAVSPVLYSPTYFSGPLNSKGGILKGVDVDRELALSTTLRRLKAGSVDRLRDPEASPPGIILGSRLAEDTGMMLNANIDILTDEMAGPAGIRPVKRRFKVCGFFETGFFEVDDNWAYTSIGAAERALGINQINQIELNVDDLNRAADIAKGVEMVAGPRYTTTTWMERNKQLLGALKMERIVTIIVISLIELVAALNIFITLVMMVMEKYRDIAILMSMGARLGQIRRIFMLQGVLIGVVGSAIGLVVGHVLCWLADKYRWIPLDETVYSMRFVPFEPRIADAFWIAGLAILVSFLATLYPARNATRVAPAEVLRYE
jgi:lipoprotein-releasing system permease protein